MRFVPRECGQKLHDHHDADGSSDKGTLMNGRRW